MKVKSYLVAVFFCMGIYPRAQATLGYSGFIAPTRYYDAPTGRFISPDTVVQDPTDPQSLNRYAYVRNNPMIYTDPTGNKWKLSDVWNKIGDLVRIVLSQPPRQPRSDTGENRPGSPSGGPGIPSMPSQPNSDLRSIIAIQQTPILFSGPTTVLTWGIMDSLSDRLLNSGEYSRFASNIYGHRASEKEKRALAAALGLGASYGYHRIVGYQPKTYGGRGYAEKGTDINGFPGLDAGIDGVNNIGYAHTGPPQLFFDEGSSFSRFTNNIYGVNAIAGMHDQFQIQLEQRWGAGARTTWNIPGMPVAAVATYPALNWQPIWLFEDELRGY